MNLHQEMVRAFMEAMHQPVPDRPTLAELRAELRVELIREEAREFATAAEDPMDWVGMIDALCDLLYVTYGAAVEMGIDLEPFFHEVHRTNMEKTGGPIREDGKLLKPTGWKPPDIKGLLEKTIEDAESSRAATRHVLGQPMQPPRPTAVVAGIEKPVLVFSVEECLRHIPEEAASGLIYAFETGQCMRGVWLIPHPDFT